ncbi:MAG: hypothetical protein DWB45_04125 [Xanthomonadales bacterium]|nr:hypothetical protein [Xanthomonadales bacterium]MDL1870094.1 hypothetical protein [Gammaproteobacteria bacterium PRO6]
MRCARPPIAICTSHSDRALPQARGLIRAGWRARSRRRKRRRRRGAAGGVVHGVGTSLCRGAGQKS